MIVKTAYIHESAETSGVKVQQLEIHTKEKWYEQTEFLLSVLGILSLFWIIAGVAKLIPIYITGIAVIIFFSVAMVVLKNATVRYAVIDIRRGTPEFDITDADTIFTYSQLYDYIVSEEVYKKALKEQTRLKKASAKKATSESEYRPSKVTKI